MTNNNNTKGKPQFCSFLISTYDMLEKYNESQIISWTESGLALVVKNPKCLSMKILPQYFKHRNYSSFLRQLNLYNFKKSKNELGQSVFKHKYFRQGMKSLLKYIKRRNKDVGKEYPSEEFKSFNLTKQKEEHKALQDQASSINQNLTELIQKFSTYQETNQILLHQMEKVNAQYNLQESICKKKFQKIEYILNTIVDCVSKSNNILSLFSQKFLSDEMPQVKEMIISINCKDENNDKYNLEPDSQMPHHTDLQQFCLYQNFYGRQPRIPQYYQFQQLSHPPMLEYSQLNPNDRR